MKHVKMLGLLAVAAGVLMAFAGVASATTITQAPPFTGTVKAESEGVVALTGAMAFECNKSALEWSVESHGASVAIAGPLTKFTLEECGSHTVTVVNRGSLELHATSGGNGTLTSTGAEITVLFHHFLVGTTHCIYKTNETDLGTLTGSRATGGTATLDAVTPLLQQATDSACGEAPYLDGSYKFTTPDYLDVE